jgi:phage terminase large subunit
MSEFVMPKRPRGRPKSKPANKKIFKRPKGRPKKSESAKTNAVKTTVIFNWTRQAKEQIVINRGGRGSSKSVSVAQLLVEYFFTIPNIRILILRKTQPSLRISVIPLIYGLIDSYNLRSRIIEEKVDRNIWSPVKGLIHFGGLDDPEKVKCFHPDTDILTKDGFKSIKEVKKGDIVASVNPQTFETSYFPITEMYQYFYKGEMVSPVSETGVRNPYTNFCVTPEHKMLVYSKRSLDYYHKGDGKGRWRWKEAGTLPLYDGGNYSIPVSSKWDIGDKPDIFEIPKNNWNDIQGGKKNKNGKKPTVFPIIPWLKFFGWYISEGCTDGNMTTLISQKKPEGVKRLLDDLKDFPINYKYSKTTGQATIYSKDLNHYLKRFGDCYSKFIPRDILNLHPSLLKYLLESLIAGDGRKESSTHWVYSTSSKQLSEDICELGVKLGFSVSIKEGSPKFSYKGKVRTGKPCWHISLVKREKSSLVRTTRIPYEGMVYCPTVEPYHTVITRYKGKVSISGQSSDWNIIWCEEATEFTYEDFINLKMLLRSPVRNNIRNKIYMSLNPIDEYHFIKEKILNNSSEDVVDIHSTYLHNPFLTDDYRQTIESLQYQNQNFYRIFALGEWGRLEHLIYSNWESVPFLYDKGQEIYGLDFGFVNPTALVRVQVDDKDIGVEEKLYESGLTNQTLIQRLGQLIPLEKRGHSIIYADSEDLNRIQEIRESGFWIVPVTKGPNSVVSGINYLKSCRIHITQGSDNLIKEIRGYSNKVDKNGRVYEEPVKFADHLMDAMRYAVFSFHKEGRDSPESSFFKSV